MLAYLEGERKWQDEGRGGGEVGRQEGRGTNRSNLFPTFPSMKKQFY